MRLCLANRCKVCGINLDEKMNKEVLQVLTRCILCSALLAGCSGSKPADMPPVQSIGNIETGEAAAVHIVRIQSSSGDIQQVEVSVKEWLKNGQDDRPFDKKKTPFDIQLDPGNYSLQIGSPAGGPEIKVQWLEEENGAWGFVQSREVCIKVAGEGGFEVKGCSIGLR